MSQSSFDCSNAGNNIVTLFATDVFGITGSATATVTVQEKVAPVVKVKNITVALNANGAATITSADVDNGSTDNCGIKTLTLDKSQFTCSNVGVNVVKLTAVDGSSNSATGTLTVTIIDNILPVAKTKDISVTLVNGTYSLTPAMVNNLSSDNCSIKSMSVSPSVFNCSSIGQNTVTLTVVDNSGNVSSAPALVNVTGLIPSCSISLTASLTAVNNDLTKLFLGYGPSTVTLTANGLGGTTFTHSWSGPFLSSTSGKSVVFKPTSAGIFTLNCVTKNQFGCDAACSVVICVRDIRSETAGKILICHQSADGIKRTLSVTAADAAKMLVQYPSDELGGCKTSCATPTTVVRKVVNISNAKSLYSVPGYVIAQNPYTNGTGWSAGLYTASEMTNKGLIKGVNILSSLRWRIDRDMNYGSQHRIYKGVNIYMYHYANNTTFPNTNKPGIPAGAVKVFSGDLDFQLPDIASCFMDVQFNLSEFYYDGVSSVVVYIEKTTPALSPSVTDPWASYNEDTDTKKIRFVGNWSGINFTTSNYNSTLKQNRYPQVIFNESNTVALCDPKIFNVSSVPTNKVSAPVENLQTIPVDPAIANAEVVVYPNPSADAFNIRLNSQSMDAMNIKVYNMAGTLMYEGSQLNSSEVHTFGSQLPLGFYFVEIQQGTMKKVIKVNKMN